MTRAGLGVLAALLASPVAAAQSASVTRTSWLAGCWERQSGKVVIEEHWLWPRVGTQLGVGRTTRGGTTVQWEFLRIVERESALVYIAAPSGQEQAEFVASETTDSTVVFENPTHDFPQRIAYRRRGDSLFARIDGIRQGAARGRDFPFARVPCP
jgi:hypothetical protein